jgi:hypothetical protein
MKFPGKLALLFLMAMSVSGFAADKKTTAAAGKLVDSGSFGVFVHGKRVATETFQIEQMADSSVIKSEFKTDGGANQAMQTAELVISTNGDLMRYMWNESSPGKATAMIEPQNQFLVQHINGGPTVKMIDQQYILPSSTVILDDYFFSQREVLAWRYLAANCRPDGGGGCRLGRAQFGALIPRQRTSMLVNMEFIGRETITVHGKKRELSRFNLQGDGMDWGLWLDDSNMLIRVYVAAEATEVVRD